MKRKAIMFPKVSCTPIYFHGEIRSSKNDRRVGRGETLEERLSKKGYGLTQ